MISGHDDWLTQLLKAISAHGFGSFAIAALAAVVRFALRFDTTAQEVVASFALALVVIALFAPALAEYLELGPRAAAGMGAGMALVARPLVVGLLTIGQRFKRDPEAVTRWLRWK